MKKFFENLRLALPRLMVALTGQRRYIPTVEWSKNSWTHNIFRVYELIFGRRWGIKREMSVNCYRDEKGKLRTLYKLHSFEAMCAFVEQQIRQLFKFRIRLPIKVWIPILQPASSLPAMSSPFMLAIAFDASAATATGFATSINWTHTCTGSNRAFFEGIMGPPNSGGYVAPTGTYNGVSVSSINSVSVDNSTSDWYLTLFGLLAPATGSNTVNASQATSVAEACSVSYTGVLQSGFPDGNASQNSGGSNVNTKTFTETTTAANCWQVLYVRWMTGVTSAGTGATFRVTGQGPYTSFYDSNGPLSAGSNSMTINNTTTTKAGGVIASFAPAVTGPANVKTVDGLPIGSVKTVDGLAIGSIKTIDGLN